jgi:hypothetical protein
MLMGMPILQIQPPGEPPPRYSTRAFPPYRYVPGLHPHPVANPQGHSFNPAGEHPPAGALLPPERWRECEDYLYGVDLYNYWYWWEAHEAWEGIWQQSDKRSAQGHFLQGLIQISAAQLKRHVGHTEGVARLLARAQEHLAFVTPADGLYMGLNLPGFLEHVRKWFAGTVRDFPFVQLAG